MIRRYMDDEDGATIDQNGYTDNDPDLTDNTDNEDNDDDQQKITFLCDYDQEDSYISSTEYTTLQLGMTTLVVSSDGIIRKAEEMFSASMGYALPGTPYRTFPVEVYKGVIEEYYVHDIVWRAFNGELPDGWEVRHTFWEPKKGAEFYSNSLENLQIYPSTVSYMPSVRKCLPDLPGH